MSKSELTPTPPVLRTRDVCQRLNVSRETLRRWRAAGAFPNPKLLGPGSLAWESHEIENWLKSRPIALLEGSKNG